MKIGKRIYQALFLASIVTFACTPLMNMQEMVSKNSKQQNQKHHIQPRFAHLAIENKSRHEINVVRDFYVISKGSFCQLVIKMSELPHFRANTLGKPNRLYVDLSNTIIKPAKQIRTINDGFIKQIRTGQFNVSTARIVLDTNEKVGYEIYKDNTNKELVIEFFPEAFSVYKSNEKNNRVDRSFSTNNSTFLNKNQTINQNLAATLVQELGLKIKTIIIDPGHGGKDPGAVGPGGIYEKNLTLDIALKLKRLLEHDGNFNVLLTRENDVFIPLEERTAFANRHNGDLFISIHVNSHSYSDRSGIETYYLALARDDDSRAVAAYENRFAQTKLNNLEDIIQNIMKNSKVEESVHFAKIIQQNLIHKTKQMDRGVKTAGFFVLIGAKMPSILTEVGFVSNHSDIQLLKKEKYRVIIAQALFEGIVRYQNRLVTYNR